MPFVAVSVCCTDKVDWYGCAGVDVASSVVSVGRCLLRLAWNHSSLEEQHYAVNLVPHKRQLLSTTGESKAVHQCNTMRDAVVLGLWSDMKSVYENTTHTYLGGGTEHHPPYVYSLVFRDAPFMIA